MAQDFIERLSSLFESFPGIGPRQAQRFVMYLLRSSPAVRRELIEAVQGLASSVHQCSDCFRFHAKDSALCSICDSENRDKKLLAVVATDADLTALERSGTYRGTYFVLGGTISLASEKMTGLRLQQLLKAVQSKNKLAEVVLAFPANPEGDATAIRVSEELRALEIPSVKITTLGRGLSTGSELEYADPETLRNAFNNRK